MTGSLAQAHSEAAKDRARWLLALAQSQVTDRQLFEAAASGKHPGLRSLRLRAVLQAMPGMSTRAANMCHDRLVGQAEAYTWRGAEVPPQPTVAWLLDARGDRAALWAFALAAPMSPYPGFPYPPSEVS